MLIDLHYQMLHFVIQSLRIHFVIKDFIEGGVGMDILSIHVCFVNDLSSDVSEYYEWMIFRKVSDIENGHRDGEVVWV